MLQDEVFCPGGYNLLYLIIRHHNNYKTLLFGQQLLSLLMVASTGVAIFVDG
jgi:hypothetical protein